MNQKQVKRLRRAMGVYVTERRPGLALGPGAAIVAVRLANIVHTRWSKLASHHARGIVGGLLRAGRLERAAQVASS